MHATDGAARGFVEWRDRHAGIRATDADVSVYRLRAEKASGFALYQTQDDICRPPVRRVCRVEARRKAFWTAFVGAIDVRP
jgi:hypothetical protein